MHLNLTESCAEAGIYATSEAERAYWLSRVKSYLTASVEIDVHAFHDALGLMYPMNWRSSQNGECETFMLAEMVCGNVTEIYARIGIRYYRMRDYSNLDHAEILARVKEGVQQRLIRPSPKGTNQCNSVKFRLLHRPPCMSRCLRRKTHP